MPPSRLKLRAACWTTYRPGPARCCRASCLATHQATHHATHHAPHRPRQSTRSGCTPANAWRVTRTTSCSKRSRNPPPSATAAWTRWRTTCGRFWPGTRSAPGPLARHVWRASRGPHRPSAAWHPSTAVSARCDVARSLALQHAAANFQRTVATDPGNRSVPRYLHLLQVARARTLVTAGRMAKAQPMRDTLVAGRWRPAGLQAGWRVTGSWPGRCSRRAATTTAAKKAATAADTTRLQAGRLNRPAITSPAAWPSGGC